ncbi:hypothetical protein C8E83_3693 [Frondihabitans australicus]|uniref:Uncharacterized protein n=1 Tax=Frondihabitans australicus TaxID=386892 RepID=A0A495IMX0_9MICO|nr:hypothetical protein C8E83_3693 [Frondihabitans australicus]
MNPTTGLVRGLPAYTWVLVSVVSAVLGAAGLVGTVITLLALTARGIGGFDAAIAPMVAMLLGLVGLSLCLTALPRVSHREAEAGYTTVPLLAGDLPLRDPHDGRVLIPAGTVVPLPYRVSLRPARRGLVPVTAAA